MVFLACGPTMVELIEFADPQLVQDRLGDRVAPIDHVALQVADLQGASPLGRMHFTRADTSAGVIWQLLELADGSPTRRDAAPDLQCASPG